MSAFHSIEKGLPSNPAVIVIHGLLGSSRNLYRLVETLANSGFRALAYDQRGHGHSLRSDDYSIRALAGDVFSFMDSKKLERAHLVGHSLGARVALEASMQNPQRVKSVVMLDAGYRVGSDALKAIRAVIDPLPEFFATKGDAEQALARHEATSSESIKQWLLSNLRTKDSRQEWAFDLVGIRQSLLDGLKIDQSQALRALGAPLLVVRGDRSEHFSASDLKSMSELNPRAKTVTIPNAGHWLHVDNFVDTSNAVLQFLKAEEK